MSHFINYYSCGVHISSQCRCPGPKPKVVTEDRCPNGCPPRSKHDCAEVDRHLGNVLAVLNGDGGHYQGQHGTAKAVDNGLARFYERITAYDATTYAISQVLTRAKALVDPFHLPGVIALLDEAIGLATGKSPEAVTHLLSLEIGDKTNRECTHIPGSTIGACPDCVAKAVREHAVKVAGADPALVDALKASLDKHPGKVVRVEKGEPVKWTDPNSRPGQKG